MAFSSVKPAKIKDLIGEGRARKRSLLGKTGTPNSPGGPGLRLKELKGDTLTEETFISYHSPTKPLDSNCASSPVVA